AHGRIRAGGDRPGRDPAGGEHMTAAAWGAVLGIGILLLASPWLWPASAEPRRARRRRPLALPEEALPQAGMARTSVWTVILVALLLGIAATVLVLARVPVVALAVAAGIAVTALPFALIAARARRRGRAMRAVWPDAVDHLVASLRSCP